ncbi:hypothetical protein CSB37_02610 [bacterium DOLZORAL124_38_8]|nr:MAG: hypothetical protein CSB37_02610 [bacterium DOLZORAL124_38_8]
MWRFLHRFSKGVLLGALLPVVVLMTPILFVFSQYDAQISSRKDCAVVFGAAVWKGNKPSHALYDRTKTALDLYKNHQVSCLVLSGGPSKYGTHEAEVMRQMAVKQGIPSSDIILDLNGLSTLETFKNLPKGKSFVFVSNDFHLARIKMFAWKFGLKDFDLQAAKYHAGRYGKEFYFIFRELGGLAAYGLFWWK